MKITFHTPKGKEIIDSETVTDQELASLEVTRESLNEIVAANRDPLAEIDDITTALGKAGIQVVKGE